MAMLDEELGWNVNRSRVLVVEDSVSSPASFFLPYLLNKALAAPDPLVIFVGLKEPFVHYVRILKKQNFIKTLRQAPKRNVWIIFDDISLLEVLTEGNGTHLLEFLHYCRTLASDKQACSLGLFTHEDVYNTEDVSSLIHELEHLSDTIIRVKPLGTGRALDVHGQVIIEHRMPCRTESACSTSLNLRVSGRSHALHYKVMESSAAFFAPGRSC